MATIGFSWQKYQGNSRPSSKYGHIDPTTGQYIKVKNPYHTDLQYGDPGWYDAHAKEMAWDREQQWDKKDQITAWEHTAQGQQVRQAQYKEYVALCEEIGITPMGGDADATAEAGAEALEEMEDIQGQTIEQIAADAAVTLSYIGNIRSQFPGSIEPAAVDLSAGQ